MHISELDTPVMLVDLTVLEANIRRLQAELTAAGVNGRPHIQRWRRQWPLCRRGRCRRTGYHPTPTDRRRGLRRAPLRLFGSIRR